MRGEAAFEPQQLSEASEAAISALMAGARHLELSDCQELARRITEWVVGQSLNQHDLHENGLGDARYIKALRAAAEVVGHVPSSTEYQREYKRRRQLGDESWPSLSAVSKRFRGYAFALAAAGLGPEIPRTALQRSRGHQLKKIHRYDAADIEALLRACFEDCGGGRLLVRDWDAWREDHLRGSPGARRAPGNFIPHWSTIHRKYGSWAAALKSAGVPYA